MFSLTLPHTPVQVHVQVTKGCGEGCVLVCLIMFKIMELQLHVIRLKKKNHLYKRGKQSVSCLDLYVQGI